LERPALDELHAACERLAAPRELTPPEPRR